MAGLVRLLAEIDTVLLILEDAHWADRLSCQLLEALCQELASTRTILCMTSHNPLKGENSDFHLSLPRLSQLPGFNDLSLQPLSGNEIAQMAASMMGQETLDAALAPKIAAAARGNPLVAQEMMKGLAEQGILYRQGGRWHVDAKSVEKVKPSEELEDWLIGKAQHLDKHHRTAIEASALIRHRITFDAIQHLLQIDPTTLYYVLSDLVRERLLAETKIEGKQVYSLPGEMLEQNVYAQIPEATRVAWHQRVAEHLEALPQETRDAVLDDIAYHYARGKTPQKALPFFLRCAERAAGLMAHAQAIGFFNAALEIGQKSQQVENLPGIFLRIGELYLEMDNRSEARRHLQEARERSKREEREELLGRAYWRLAEVCLRDRLLDEASAHLDRCRAIVDKLADRSGMVRQLLLSAKVQEARFARDQALLQARQALEIATGLDRPLLGADAALAVGTLLNALGKFEEALDPLRKAERIYSSIEHPEGVFLARMEKARGLAGLHQVEDAMPLVRKIASEIDNMRPALRVQGCLLVGQIEGKALQLGSAQRHLDKALRIAEEMEDPYLLAQAQFVHGEAILSQVHDLTGRRRRDALRLLKQSRDLFERGGFVGERDRVRAVLEESERQFIEGDVSALRRERDYLRMLQRVIAAVNSVLDLERPLNLSKDIGIVMAKAERGFLILTQDSPARAGADLETALRIAVSRNIYKENVHRPGRSPTPSPSSSSSPASRS